MKWPIERITNPREKKYLHDFLWIKISRAFSVRNKLEKSAEKSLQITQIQVVLIFLSQKPANNKIQKFIFSLNFIMEMNLYLVASYAKGKNLNHSIARPNFCSAPFKVTLLEIPESPEEYREKLLAKLHRCRSNRT